MPIVLKKPPKPKRKAGTRAGMTKAVIALAAAKQLEAGGPRALSATRLAKTLGVSPTTIFAHFRGEGELEDEIVRVALLGVGRPIKPSEPPREYLIELFADALKALDGRPTIATLAALRLRDQPLLIPHLAERILASVVALGIAGAAIPSAFERSLDALCATLLLISGRSNPQAQKAAAARIVKAAAALAPGEFPHLTKFGAALAAHAIETAAGDEHASDVAERAVDELLQAIGVDQKPSSGSANKA